MLNMLNERRLKSLNEFFQTLFLHLTNTVSSHFFEQIKLIFVKLFSLVTLSKHLIFY